MLKNLNLKLVMYLNWQYFEIMEINQATKPPQIIQIYSQFIKQVMNMHG